MKKCTLQDPRICFARLVVYQMTCTQCNLFYIGSTYRDLHTRIREHLRGRSTIYQHAAVCRASWKVDVIGHANDPVNLRIREALLIREKKPGINGRDEFRDISGLLL